MSDGVNLSAFSSPVPLYVGWRVLQWAWQSQLISLGLCFPNLSSTSHLSLTYFFAPISLILVSCLYFILCPLSCFFWVCIPPLSSSEQVPPPPPFLCLPSPSPTCLRSPHPAGLPTSSQQLQSRKVKLIAAPFPSAALVCST